MKTADKLITSLEKNKNIFIYEPLHAPQKKEKTQEKTQSGNKDRKTLICFNLQKYVEKHCNDPQ